MRVASWWSRRWVSSWVERVAAVSLWVEAGSETAAWEMANRALVEEMRRLGLA